MIRTAGGVLAGAWATLRVPFWLGGERLAALLRPPPGTRPDAAPPRGAVRAAILLLRVLARVPGLPWRNTCLYRSAAECLVLRRYGVPAMMRIGVKNAAGGPGGAITAHAWVVRADRDEAAAEVGPDELTPLYVRA